jgi:ABC-type hemin transport system ATPase subunit
MRLSATIGLRLGALDLDVDLAVEPGAVLAILGPNGSGEASQQRGLADASPDCSR